MKKILCLAIVAILTLCCAALPALAESHPLMYKVTDKEGHSIYLLGTMHVISGDTLPIARLDEVGAGYCFFEEWKAYYGGERAYRPIAEGILGLGELGDGVDPATIRAFNFDVYFEDADHRSRIAEALASTCLLNPHGPHPSADMTV